MRALITGITGQDGSYLAELLLAKGYEVHGIIRRSSSFNTERIDHIYDKLHLHYGDMHDSSGLASLVRRIEPLEIYHLAAQSHVRVSFDMPEYTVDVTGLSTIRLLEAARGIPCKFYQASSSELFGSSPPPQNENTRFRPRSPYAIAKVAGYWAAVHYREAYNMFVVNGILFNHESPRRGPTFVTRKVTRGIASILRGETDTLWLGDLCTYRDWGYAPEYVEAMWLMLQQDKPDDYVIATGESCTVQKFVQTAFEYAGLDWTRYVRFDSRYCRPTEVINLCGDARKAQAVLGWEPKTRFDELVRIMVDADLEGVE